MKANSEKVFTTDESELNEIVAITQKIIARAEKYRNAYFWSNAGTCASERRRLEFDEVDGFQFDGDEYLISQSVTNSCRNVYFRSWIERNGRKTTLTAIRTVARKAAERLAQ